MVRPHVACAAAEESWVAEKVVVAAADVEVSEEGAGEDGRLMGSTKHVSVQA